MFIREDENLFEKYNIQVRDLSVKEQCLSDN
jgi:hypothetical protein